MGDPPGDPHLSHPNPNYDDPNCTSTLQIDNLKSLRYNSQSYGPYVISMSDPDGNLGTKHPMIIGKLIQDHKVEGVINVSKINKNIIDIEFSDYVLANRFMDHPNELKTKYRIYIPYNRLTRRIIIKDVEPSITLLDIKNSITRNYFKTYSIRRIFKREHGKLTPTYNIDATIESQLLPKNVFILYHKCKVVPYIYPVLQCNHCLMFGHKSHIKNTLICKNSKKCSKCGETTILDPQKCTGETKCTHCQGRHDSSDRNCPQYLTEKQLKEIMATQNISYKLAKNKLDTPQPVTNLNTNDKHITTNNNSNPLLPPKTTQQFPPLKNYSEKPQTEQNIKTQHKYSKNDQLKPLSKVIEESYEPKNKVTKTTHDTPNLNNPQQSAPKSPLHKQKTPPPTPINIQNNTKKLNKTPPLTPKQTITESI
ncbi:uncharacterized protein [Bemisia tabaci]|uniref:uncharacterized protein n=1 Tax=Bemisia tabaci TaxID=7038 RepID=UPI003B2871EC